MLCIMVMSQSWAGTTLYYAATEEALASMRLESECIPEGIVGMHLDTVLSLAAVAQMR